MMGATMALLLAGAGLVGAVPRTNESRAQAFARRAASRDEKTRVIHGSGGGWSADDDRRMMMPYWDAQAAGGTLLRINAASFLGYDNATEVEIERRLNLEFELLPDLQGTSCPSGVMDEETVERINAAAGVWFGGGLPGRVVSCLFGYNAEPFGINSSPEMVTPVLQALREHPLVGGISAGAMMQPSAALYNGNEISYNPNLANSASAIRIGESLMNNHGTGFVLDQFTIHSHFSERGYQGMMPVALVQRQAEGLNWAAGFDEGGVGHYFEGTGEVFTIGVEERGTGIALFSDCVGSADAQDCQHHFVSDGDIWNSRLGTFDMDAGKVPCSRSQVEPEVSECVFTPALAEAQDYRRIAKQTAGSAIGTTVENWHTAPSGEVVQVIFSVTGETQAWCDAGGTVVSFTNLRVSQTRNPPEHVARKHKAACISVDPSSSY